MGTALRAKARIQINLAVSQVRDIKQVTSFPDIVFPIIWFEDVSTRAFRHPLLASETFYSRVLFDPCESAAMQSRNSAVTGDRADRNRETKRVTETMAVPAMFTVQVGN